MVKFMNSNTFTKKYILDNKPDDATHYNDTDDIYVVYMRLYGGRMQYFDYKDEWSYTLFTLPNIKRIDDLIGDK